jgi:dethiobiotin synthetase
MGAKPPRGIFITGTGTGVGKTYVGCMIAADLRRTGRRVGVYKPVASGCAREGDMVVSQDAVALWEAAGRPATLDWVCPQRFAMPLAPHLAARVEGKEVDRERLKHGLSRWVDHCDIVIVEGAGGLLSPITDDDYVADLARDFGYPLLIVAPNSLGVINGTLQTLTAATAHCPKLPVAGIVLSQVAPQGTDPSAASNRIELSRRCGRPVLADVAFGADRFGSPCVDWFALGATDGSRPNVRQSL